MRNVIIVLAVAVVLAWSGLAHGDTCTFNVASGTWVSDGSWDTHAPTSADTAYIAEDRTATISTNDAAVCNTFRLGRRDSSSWPWAYYAGHIVVDGGSLTTTSGGSHIGNNGGSSTITQNDGIVTLTSTTYLGGYGVGSGTYTLNDGTFSATFRMGYNGSGAGHYNQTGGIANIADLAMQGASGCSITVSGGTLNVRHIIVDSAGELHIVGSDAGTITMNEYWNWTQGNRYKQTGTLKVDINAAGNDVTDIVLGSNPHETAKAQFETGSILDMGLLGAAPAQDTYFLLITAPDGIVDNGLSLTSGDEVAWRIDKTATTLGVTYIIPEPATLALLGIGGLGVLIRRRRK